MTISYFANEDLETLINNLSLNTVLIGSAILILLVALAIWVVKGKHKKLKMPLFVAIIAVISATTLMISGSTVYLNVKSASGGPVHWHADIEVWACGNELELRDPVGALSNKIGTPTLHEHNDKRVHLEGVPVTLPYDASLGKFMNVIGGEITKDAMVIPVNSNGDLFENNRGEEDGNGSGAPSPELVNPFVKDGPDGKVASFVSGQKCGDQAAEVQVFAYKYDAKSKTYKQTKLADPQNYDISREPEVPSGDCVIFEFDVAKSHTNKLCRQYGIRDKNKCDHYGVPEADRNKICEITEDF